MSGDRTKLTEMMKKTNTAQNLQLQKAMPEIEKSKKHVEKVYGEL